MASCEKWTKVDAERWERADGAVVKFDRSTQWLTSQPYLPRHRAWIGYGPGELQTNFLGYHPKRRKRGGRSPNRSMVKFRSAEAAMEAVNKAYPASRLTPKAEGEVLVLNPD